MAADRKWALITTGEAFEALATTLIFFEDPGAALFGRRGKDGGQDARSGDDKRVFQAKHHADEKASTAIGDAKKEADKLKKYLTPGHPRYEQWKGVKHWRLVTNAPFNPTDHQTWITEVVPLFAALGLTADYWEQAHLNGLLHKHPEVDRSFFQNEVRAFLTLPEIRARLPLEEPFLRRASLTDFHGRETELLAVRTFLASDELFMLVHGSGGIGKTRLLLEAGEQIAAEGAWQVLWANVATMASSGTWFEAIVPERPTLLLVDEPDDEEILRVLAEQLGNRVGRTTKWKVAVAVRSPKDPVLRFLFGPRMKSRVGQINIAALPVNDAEAICADLLVSGTLSGRPEDWRKHVARELAKRFSNHPVWLTLAVHSLETSGDLAKVPETAEALADLYLDEIKNQQHEIAPPQVEKLLRWVALLNTVNREDQATIELLKTQSELADTTVTQLALTRLVERRALTQRGARNRLLELKPDVLRDHVLLRWLSVDLGFGATPVQPSDEAQTLVQAIAATTAKGTLGSLGRSMLQSLARTERILKFAGTPVSLLDPFFSALRSAIDTATASQRIAMAEVLVDIGAFRPLDVVAVSRLLRTSPVATETNAGLFRNRDLTQDDVVLDLAWPVYHAALGAETVTEREAVLDELSALAEAEAEIEPRRQYGLPNDGKRAAALIGRTLEGGPNFVSDFEDAATGLALRLLTNVFRRDPTKAERLLFKALLKPAVSIEREQTWSDGPTFHIQKTVVLPGQEGWTTRIAILDRVKAMLSDDATVPATRSALWEVFAEAHRSLNHVRDRGNAQFKKMMRDFLLEDLTWATSILDTRQSETDEITSARDLWDWHARFEADAELKDSALRLEKIYARNDLANEFEQLLPRDDWDAREPRAEEKAAVLAAAQSAGAIESFFERARRFLGDKELSQVAGVAWNLGTRAETSDSVRAFVRSTLASHEFSPRTSMAIVAASGWINAARNSKGSRAAYDIAMDLATRSGGDRQRLELLYRLYGMVPRPRDWADLDPEEYKYIRSLKSLFLANGAGPAFISCVGWAIHHDWSGLSRLLEEVLDEIPVGHIDAAVARLTDAVYWGIRNGDRAHLPAGIGNWLLDQALRVPDLDHVAGNMDWEINEVLKIVGRLPLTWLLPALLRRQTMEAGAGEDKVRGVGHESRLSRYVVPISAAQVTDPAIRRTIEGLVALASDHGTIGYFLHEILHDVDPDGLVVPEEIGRRIQAANDEDEIWRLARLGGGYPIGGSGWRAIARPILLRANQAATKEQRLSLFSALTDHRPRSWSGAIGEVPALFTTAVDQAHKQLENETDATFRPFLEWRVAVAETELRDQEERAKEERGE
jgi:hypothetical protein